MKKAKRIKQLVIPEDVSIENRINADIDVQMALVVALRSTFHWIEGLSHYLLRLLSRN